MSVADKRPHKIGGAPVLKQSGGNQVHVYLDNFEFNPTVVSIYVGDTVTWWNVATPPQFHSVVADDGSFASYGFSIQQSWNMTFFYAGIFDYHCNYISSMKGRVMVYELRMFPFVFGFHSYLFFSLSLKSSQLQKKKYAFEKPKKKN